MEKIICGILLYNLSYLHLTEGLQFCTGGYFCHSGHCCGRGRCCTYYYEIWWFWLLWLVIGLLTMCCFYHHRRMKKQEEKILAAANRSQNNSGESQRHGENTQLEAANVEPEKIFQLPSYDEVKTLPKEPPSYTDMCYSLKSTSQEESNIQITDTTPHTYPLPYQPHGELSILEVLSDSSIPSPTSIGAPPSYSSENLHHLSDVEEFSSSFQIQQHHVIISDYQHMLLPRNQQILLPRNLPALCNSSDVEGKMDISVVTNHDSPPQYQAPQLDEYASLLSNEVSSIYPVVTHTREKEENIILVVKR